MKNITLVLLSFFIVSCGSKLSPKQELAQKIADDKNLVYVDSLARLTIKTGFDIESVHSQIWVREMNTFIEHALEVVPRENIKNAILLFFAMQQPNGETVDGYVLHEDFTWSDNTPYYSKAAPEHVGFKNTVQTDQETSLIQMVGKYILKTGDTAILQEDVAGKTVEERIEDMINYLMTERYNVEYGLLWGAMTADWGDIQPNDSFGKDLNEFSHEAIDVYDNAMMIIALDYLEKVVPDPYKKAKWAQMSDEFSTNTRRYLWDVENAKFIPHIYPSGSPIPTGFDENQIFYHGGTAVAIEAALLTNDEIKDVLDQMVLNVQLSGMPSIGMTMYPAYPKNFFKGSMKTPYVHQNGGDWTWFGGRMIQQLIDNGFVEEAYQQVQPMLKRVVKNKNFFEWYAMGGVPRGSENFKGSAGVLAKSIEMFKAWSKENHPI
ncbi:hypothetical protein [Bacteroides propionicifaciens]|uniref:hypothetical protein n=3 Tax=Bacteroides propionicifaciens TaxID=392838 RepID=UPI000364E46A|nr:hypothetical protein [Bacteroides propionicifaciens]